MSKLLEHQRQTAPMIVKQSKLLVAAACSCASRTRTCTWSASSARRAARRSRTRATTTSTASCTATSTPSSSRARTRPRPTSSPSPCHRTYIRRRRFDGRSRSLLDIGLLNTWSPNATNLCYLKPAYLVGALQPKLRSRCVLDIPIESIDPTAFNFETRSSKSLTQIRFCGFPRF